MAVTLATAAPARASIQDCLNLAEDLVGAGGKLAFQLVTNPQCVDQLQAVLAGAAALAVIEHISGSPLTEGNCTSALSVLTSQAGVDPDLIKKLQDLLKLVPGGADAQTFLDCACPVAEIGADVVQSVMDHFLGCANTAGELLEAAGKLLSCILSVGLVCGDDDSGPPVAYCSFPAHTGSPPNGVCSSGMQCASCGGLAVWNWCSAVPHGIEVFAGFCACEPPYTPQYGQPQYEGGVANPTWLMACTCDSPKVSVAGQCFCPINEQLKESVCVPCSDHEKYSPAEVSDVGGFQILGQPPKCIGCPLGEKASPDHTSCIPACDGSKGEYWDGTCKQCPSDQHVVYGIGGGGPKGGIGHCEPCPSGERANSKDPTMCGVPACAAGQVTLHGFTNPNTGTTTVDSCFSCSKDTHAVHPNQNSSNGTCEPCADGFTALPGSAECHELNCSPNAYRDPDDPHACKACPSTQIYIPAEKEIIASPGGEKMATFVAGHCGCGENQRLEGDKCVCAANSIKVSNPTIGGNLSVCICPEGAHLDQAAFACVCAAGATLDPTGTKCTCPTGQRLEGDKCVSPTLQKILLRKDCSTLGPNFINNPKNPAACVRCPAGRIANNAGTACVRAPSAPVQRIIPPKRSGEVAKPALQCPPRTAPNAAGTACIPQLDMPGFEGAPGSLAPAGRGVPGVGSPTRR